MSELFEKSIRTLELPVVLERLAQCCVSDEAKHRALRTVPCTRWDEVQRLQDETDAARTLIGLRGSPGFSGLRTVAESLARADRGGMLNTRELLDVAGLLGCARRVKSYYNEYSESKTVLDALFFSLRGNRGLEEHITGCILEEDEIADTASPELAEIRRHKRMASAKGRQLLQRMISSPSYAKVLQECIITQRDGRFVVPVKAECKGSVPGLIHDVSSSGATLFVEPMGVVQANNELKELEAREEKEIDRILSQLSADVASCRADIQWDYDVLVQLDLIFARGELSYRMDASRPEIRKQGGIVLRRARHPLLDPAKAVPIDVELGKDFDTLVITGPNTGGKTVTLKTLGLLTLMAQCGLHLPTADGSSVQVFEQVMADIGDEQSIEQSLSTFSAHMTNLVRILEEADENTLVLTDELGAGTDPVEGAALAIAILKRLREKGSLLAATTHYAEMKTFAMTTAGVENASCEFDVQTLRPTYKLLIGIPGKSNAFAISARLGLPEDVIEAARAQISSESIRFEDVLTQVESKRQQAEKAALEAERLLRQREEDARKAREFREQMERARDNAREKGQAEAKRILREARQVSDSVFEELSRLRKQQVTAENWQQTNEARAALRRQLNEADEAVSAYEPTPEPIPKPSRPIAVGDRVELPSIRTVAEVVGVKSDGTLQLKAGSLKLTARSGEVRLIEAGEAVPAQKKKQQAAQSRFLARSSASAELDLRGMETLEAESVVENFLDSAYRGHLTSVTIIHGKGTGALRQAVHSMLKRNKLVKNFRLGRYGEGENGVTIVEMKG